MHYYRENNQIYISNTFLNCILFSTSNNSSVTKFILTSRHNLMLELSNTLQIEWHNSIAKAKFILVLFYGLYLTISSKISPISVNLLRNKAFSFNSSDSLSRQHPDFASAMKIRYLMRFYNTIEKLSRLRLIKQHGHSLRAHLKKIKENNNTILYCNSRLL